MACSTTWSLLSSVYALDRKEVLCDVVNGELTAKRLTPVPSKGPAFPGTMKVK